MKVVIDTNIWISYLIGDLLHGIDKKILLKEIKVVVSDDILRELAEVASRPKFRNVFSAKRIKELFSLLDNYAMAVSPSMKIDACRDKKDNFLLETAMEAKADYLITGDADLLALNIFNYIKIVKPKDFEELLT